MPKSKSIRINKYLSENGYCSRREADRLIEIGNVFINDRVAQLGDKVSENDVVRVEGRDKHKPIEKVYFLLNKPSGVYAAQHINYSEPLFAVGQHTRESEGLTLLSTDNILIKRLSNPRFALDKEYVVEVTPQIQMKDIKQLQFGVDLGKQKSAPAQVRRMDENRFAIIPTEGGEEMICAMCRALGYTITSLMLSRILTLKMPSTYPVGNWRSLTESEVRQLKEAAGMNMSVRTNRK